MKPTWVAIQGTPEGERGACRVVRFTAAAPVPELHRRKRAMGMHRLGHHRMGTDIGLVPERSKGKRAVVRRWMHRTGAGRDDAPAAFGFHAAEGRADMRVGIGHAGRVRHLEEAVGRGLGTDPDRFEQDVETRLAGHKRSLLNFRIVA